MSSNRGGLLALAAVATIALTACFGPGTHPTSGPGGAPPGLYHLFEYPEFCSVVAHDAGGTVSHEFHTGSTPGAPAFFGPSYFEVRPGDASVENQGCLLRFADSDWDKKFLPDANGGFPNGTYRVGVEVPPGTYQSDSLTTGCTWARLSGFTGNGGSVIERESGLGRRFTATIQPTDVAFLSVGCTSWTKIG